MNFQENISLAQYSTMRLGGNAAFLVEVTSRDEVRLAVQWAQERNLPLIMIGEGSNIIWRDEGFPGLVIVNRMKGFDVFKADSEHAYVTIAAGEVWDEVVQKCVEMGYSGIEQLSLIPGTAGATPVQNVGAYGREIADVLVSLEAYDCQEHTFLNIPKIDCAFGYRTSRFKTTDKGRFLITAITLHLTTHPPMPPFYGSLQAYLDENSIKTYTAATIRQAVIAVRTAKLPDPKQVANNGSFFANPIVGQEVLPDLLARYPTLAYWQLPDGKVKLSAAWMIEQAGFKGASDPETGMATWSKQALVLVNEHAQSTADLLKFRQKIIDKVQAMFGVTLEQEPELIG